MSRLFGKDLHIIRVHYITLTILAFVLITGCTNIDNYNRNNNTPIELTNWEYCEVGNCDSIWKKISSPADIEHTGDAKFVLFRTTLPEWNGGSPAIYGGQIDNFMQVFLNRKKIFELGDSSSNKSVGRNINLIQLPAFKKGDLLVFRIKPKNNTVVFNGRIILGSAVQIIHKVFTESIQGLFFAAVALITSLVALILYLKTLRIKLLLGIAVFVFPLSIFELSNSLFLRIIYPAPLIYEYLNFISLSAVSIGGLFGIIRVLSASLSRYIKYLAYFNIVFLVFSIIINHLTLFSFIDILPYLLALIVLEIICSIVIISLTEKKNNPSVKILVNGSMLFFFFAALQIIIYLTKGFHSEYLSNIRILYIGFAFFIASLIWIVIQEFIETYRQKELFRTKELEAIKRENETRHEFTKNLISSQEAERNRIALELHDSVAQKLLFIKNKLLLSSQDKTKVNSEELVKELTNITGETIQEIRDITYNLRPEYLDQLGITAAIEHIIEKVSASSEIKFEANIEEIDNLLTKEHEINFFRIIQESLNNIVKHSRATDAKVNIARNGDEIFLAVIDNGRNCKKQNSSSIGGLGITGMRERAEMMGAELRIDINENTGTVVNLKYHINHNNLAEKQCSK
jgi:signal transduction histidine kinase